MLAGRLGDRNTVNSIDLVQKNSYLWCHCPIFFLLCDLIRPLLVQTWFVYFFVRVQPLSTNFAWGSLAEGLRPCASFLGLRLAPLVEPELVKFEFSLKISLLATSLNCEVRQRNKEIDKKIVAFNLDGFASKTKRRKLKKLFTLMSSRFFQPVIAQGLHSKVYF